MIYGSNTNTPRPGRERAPYERNPFDKLHGPTEADAQRVARQLARAASLVGDDSPYVDALLRTLKDQPTNRGAHLEALKIIDQAAAVPTVSQQALRSYANHEEKFYEPIPPGRSSTVYTSRAAGGDTTDSLPDTQDQTHVFRSVA